MASLVSQQPNPFEISVKSQHFSKTNQTQSNVLRKPPINHVCKSNPRTTQPIDQPTQIILQKAQPQAWASS